MRPIDQVDLKQIGWEAGSRGSRHQADVGNQAGRQPSATHARTHARDRNK